MPFLATLAALAAFPALAAEERAGTDCQLLYQVLTKQEGDFPKSLYSVQRPYQISPALRAFLARQEPFVPAAEWKRLIESQIARQGEFKVVERDSRSGDITGLYFVKPKSIDASGRVRAEVTEGSFTVSQPYGQPWKNIRKYDGQPGTVRKEATFAVPRENSLLTVNENGELVYLDSLEESVSAVWTFGDAGKRIALEDQKLFQEVLPKIKAAAEAAPDSPEKRLFAIARKINEINLEAQKRGTDLPPLEIGSRERTLLGESVCHGGGYCVASALLSHLAVGAFTSDRAWILNGVAAEQGGHAFVVTEGGYLLDASVGLAFPLRFDAEGKVEIPEPFVAQLKASGGSKQGLPEGVNLYDFLRSAYQDALTRKRAQVLRENWKPTGVPALEP